MTPSTPLPEPPAQLSPFSEWAEPKPQLNERTVTYSRYTRLTTELAAEIDVFLAGFEEFTYFQSPAYFRVCLTSGHRRPGYTLARTEGMIVGVVLAVWQAESAWPLLRFLSSRVIIWGGPVVRGNDEAVLAGLLQQSQRHLPAAQYTQIRNLCNTEPLRPVFSRAGYTYDEHLNILIDLRLSSGELWQALAPKRRNQIRRAQKEGCTFRCAASPADLRASYPILQEVYRRARLPLPAREHFEALWQQADARSGLRLFLVEWEGRIIACMFCLAQGKWLFDYYAGAYSDAYKKFPNDLLPWGVFEWAKTQGMSYFDFGGAGKPGVPYGVRDYKKQFGGALVGYGRYEQVHSGPLYRLIKTFYQRWQRLNR